MCPMLGLMQILKDVVHTNKLESMPKESMHTQLPVKLTYNV